MLTLADIVGQDRAVADLTGALRSQRVHHAWLFAGPSGVGKRTTAEAFAACLIDPSTGPDLTGAIAPDPDSEHQRLLAVGAHPDVHIITKELAADSEHAHLRSRKQRNIPVDLLRERMIGGEVRAGEGRRRHDAIVASAPSMGARRVFILDEAELLDQVGSSALLKTLEEPGPSTVIILITSSEHRLLPTIRSRCQRVAFRRLDDDAMSAWARRASVALGGSQRDRAWILRFAQGCPGQALLAVETDLLAWRDALEPLLDDADETGFTPDLGGVMASLVDDWAKARVKARAGASKEAANQRGANLLIRLLAARTRDDLDQLDDEDARRRGLRRIGALLAAEQRLRRNVSLKLVFEALAVAWCRLDAPHAPIFSPALR